MQSNCTYKKVFKSFKIMRLQFQIRTNYRPSLRRPALSSQKSRFTSTTINNDVTADATTPSYRKRSRPTTTTPSSSANPTVSSSSSRYSSPSSSTSASSSLHFKRKFVDRGRVTGQSTRRKFEENDSRQKKILINFNLK